MFRKKTVAGSTHPKFYIPKKMYWKMYFLSDMFFVLVGIYVKFQGGKPTQRGLSSEVDASMIQLLVGGDYFTLVLLS